MVGWIGPGRGDAVRRWSCVGWLSVGPSLLLLGLPGEPRPAREASDELCLRQVYEAPLPEFEPVGLSVSAVGSAASVTMWSGDELRVARVLPARDVIDTVFHAGLPGGEPLGAELVDWTDGRPVVELFEAEDHTLTRLDLATDAVVEDQAPAWTRSASGAARVSTGWVWAEKSFDPVADTSMILLRGAASAQGAIPQAATSGPEAPPGRRISQVLHVRPTPDDVVFVTEAQFPFATVRFSREGVETGRVLPKPSDLREQLEEPDLRYVIATPTIAVDGALLNTFVALRSAQRVSALRLPDAEETRLRRIPSDLALLGAVPGHRLLVAARTGRPYRLVLLRWHWANPGQTCSVSQGKDESA